MGIYKLAKDVVFREIVSIFPDDPKITSLAENARSFFYYCKQAGVGSSCFPMLGSMGLEISMGLGVSLGVVSKSFNKTVVISSDGSLFSNINALVTIGMLKPNNLLIVVLDNEMHGITGGQPTASKHIKITKLAESCNIQSFDIYELKELRKTLNDLKGKRGPTLVNVKINKQKAKFEEIRDLPSIIYKSFSDYLTNFNDKNQKI